MTLATSQGLEWATAVGTILSGAGAAFAAGVAVYVGVVRVRRRRPRLRIEQPVPERELVVVRTSDGDASAWVRLRVTNDGDREAAEDVEVVIDRVAELRPRQGFPPAKSGAALAGLSLAWSATPERQARAHIAPGSARLVDLAAAFKGSAAARQAPLVIQTAFIHADPEVYSLRSGEIAIDLVATARNADPHRYRVQVAYDGDWGSDIWGHLRVTDVRPIDARG